MKHVNKTEVKVYCADTDLYQVVWHGNYLRYLEAGRIEFLKDLGGTIDKIREDSGIILPVVQIDIKYKASAKNGDVLVVETAVQELKPHCIVFLQKIKNKKTDEICILAEVKCVGVDNNGKLFKKLPQLLKGEK